MDVDISIGGESINLRIENPYNSDMSNLVNSIVDFGKKFNTDLEGHKIERLLRKMIRGVAGCEGGCPSDAKSFVKEGFGDFSLFYIEGGILLARQSLKNGNLFSVKIFPEFD